MENREVNDKISYNLIKSARKTIAIQIAADGSVTVRVPKQCSKAAAEKFVEEKREWIQRKRRELAQRNREKEEKRDKLPEWTQEEYRYHRMLADQILRERTEYFARQMGVSFGRVTIRDPKTRWGSCSAKGNLNFSWRLILAPPEVLDYVVVHELAHRREMNHSERFLKQVELVLPDYLQRKAWLKKNGDLLMSR